MPPGAGQGGGLRASLVTSVSSAAARIAELPLFRPFFRLAWLFVEWMKALLVMRVAWLVQMTNQMKVMLLDTSTKLDDARRIECADIISKEVQAGYDYLKSEKLSQQGAVGSVLERKNDGLPDVMDIDKVLQQASKAAGLSVESAFRALKDESEVLRVSHLEALERLTGVRHTVLDFIESGGIPPSVEALYAWLEYRGIDTAVWGVGQAKTVQELFHEIWAGESEPLTDLPQRVISVVKVRLTCTDEGGTWALYETKQKFCRDGRVRPRNRPLAEKKRPGEHAAHAAIRGVQEELGSVLTKQQHEGMVVRTESIEHWEEVLFSNSFPGLETVYKLFLVDVDVPNFNRMTTGETFDSSETPELSTGKVHSWVWKRYGAVEQSKELVTVLKARYPGPGI